MCRGMWMRVGKDKTLVHIFTTDLEYVKTISVAVFRVDRPGIGKHTISYTPERYKRIMDSLIALDGRLDF